MADELTPFNIDDKHKAYLIHELATCNDLLQVKEKFEKFFGTTIRPQTVMEVAARFKDDIKEHRQNIYNDTQSLPFAHEWTIIAFAQSRIEYLSKNKTKYSRSVRKFKQVKNEETGEKEVQEYWDDIYEIDEANLKGWTELCARQILSGKKLALEKILNKIDDSQVPRSGFKPVTVNIGFSPSGSDDDGKEE